MQGYINRKAEQMMRQYLEIFPVVVLLGPRQCGKSTLIKKMAQTWKDTIYLDLQDLDDLNKLQQPTLFFEHNLDKRICLDEIQLVPGLFSVLRSRVDKNRENGKFILLGSASRDIIQKTSESLAGRVGFIHLTPFMLTELGVMDDFSLSRFWYRGGFPESYLSKSDSNSIIWRENFIRTFIERDIPQLGFQIPALQLRRFLTMCAHNQGQLVNLSKYAEAMGLTHPTIRRYIDLLEQTFIVRTLPAFESNLKKRMVKSPKLFIRDSGLLHQLLNIESYNDLLGHPVFGNSWEGLVIENVITQMEGWKTSFYRSSTGNEIDLILEKGQKCIAIECKASTSPKPTKGFWQALEVVQPDKVFVVAPVEDSYYIKNKVLVCNLNHLLDTELKSLA
jgi:predicted AAA+ superfamily ATPase